MKIVAVSQRVEIFPERGEIRDALDQRLITFLSVAGYVPVPVPNGLYTEMPDGLHHEALDVWLAAVAPMAILLSGGNDIGQCNARDLTEGWLLDYAQEHQLPLLGICRGMQMMAQWVGTGLHPVIAHVGIRHRLLGEITGEVNSYHGFALANCPKGFEVLARSEDLEIEAIRHVSLPWEGWMWHPERENALIPYDIERLRALFK